MNQSIDPLIFDVKIDHVYLIKPAARSCKLFKYLSLDIKGLKQRYSTCHLKYFINISLYFFAFRL